MITLISEMLVALEYGYVSICPVLCQWRGGSNYMLGIILTHLRLNNQGLSFQGKFCQLLWAEDTFLVLLVPT